MTLLEFFREHNKAALAFSGGVDSSYLLYAAKGMGAKVKAYYVKSAFQPDFELEDARRVAEKLKVEMEILTLDILADDTVSSNPPDRCYHCKQRIFRAILDAAKADGYPVVLDGTNASDDAQDRPGMKALAEMKILSPLRLCGLTKSDVRQLSKDAGLPTWYKPAYACLATRIPTGERITGEDLKRVEGAEDVLRSMGFTDLRVRKQGEMARIELPVNEMTVALYRRKEILEGLRPYFDKVLLDLEGRSSQ